MKHINEKKNIKIMIMTILCTVLFPVFLAAAKSTSVSADTPVALSAQARFFGRDKCVTVTVSGNADGHEVGLIAEAMSGGKAVERRFATLSGSGEVKFDAFSSGNLYSFRVIAVDKNTLAPVCSTLSLVRSASGEDIEKTEGISESLPALADGTSTALKAVTKDLILAERTLDSLEALCTETVTVEYTEDVISEETDEDGVVVTTTVQETKTEEMTRYDAISVNGDAFTEAGSRLDAAKSAYGNLRTWAAVLYQISGENGQLKSYALQAGDIAKSAEDAAVAIENDFALKQKDKGLESTGFMAEIKSIRDAHQIIKVCGGAGVLLDGGFCTYPNGADVALVSDEDSSAIILSPDNGKVTEGTVTRGGFAQDMPGIIITSGTNAAVLAAFAGEEEPCFRKYDGYALSGNNISTSLTTLDYMVEDEDSETAVYMLTDYAKKEFAIASNGTYETYEEIVEAFLASADDSQLAMSGLASVNVESAEAAFGGDLTDAYNDRRGLTEYWSCGDPANLKNDYYGIHCTTDKDGNIVGKYESFTYGVKCQELYFASPVPDVGKGLGSDHIPDSRRGCVYEKIWRNTDYPNMDDFEAAAHQPGYDPANIRTHLYEVYEYGGSVNTPLTGSGGSSGGGGGDSFAGIEGINEYDDPEGQPSVQVCHFKRYYENNPNGQVEIESVAVYNPALWEEFKSEGKAWDKVRSKCYDILRQRNYSEDGKLKLDISYVGSVPGYERNDMVYIRKYDVSDGSPMLAAEYYEPATWMSGIGMLMGYAYFTFNPTYRSEYRAYYTPEYFAKENDRTRRVPEDKRRLFYGKVRYYRSKDGSITGYNHLVSWADPREEDGGRIFFNGADTTSFPTDKFMLDEFKQKNVGILHWVIRDDNYEISNDKYELVFRTDNNS